MAEVLIAVEGLEKRFTVRRKRGRLTTYRTPGYPLTPLVFLLLLGALLCLLAAGNPRQAFLGVGVVLLGLPVYYLFVRKNVVGNP